MAAGLPPLPQLTSAAAGGAGARGSLGNSVPTPEGAAASAVPAQSAAATPAATPAPPGALGTAAESSVAKVHVVTDVLDLDISLRGGQIDRADLSQYPLHKDTPNVPVRLENDDPATLYVVQTGLTGAAGRGGTVASRDVHRGADELHASRRCDGAARPVDLDRRSAA